MSETLTPLTPKAATAKGYRQLTYPLNPDTEQWIIDNIVKDLQKGKIPTALVQQGTNIEIWRKPRCFK